MDENYVFAHKRYTLNVRIWKIESRRLEIICQANTNQNEAKIAIIMSDEVEFKVEKPWIKKDISYY